MFLWAAILLAAIFASSVWAQFNMAQCAIGFDWNKNSLGQDPCTVGSILDASCRGLTEYIYPPLANGTQYYLPPRANHSGDVMCDCNTVMYSLYMACISCQGGKIYSWTQWITQCASVYVSQYPASIPPGTAVPRWAYYNITSLDNQIWNDSVAISIGQGPEELLKRIDTVAPPASPPPILPRQVMTTTITPDPNTTPIPPTTSSTTPPPTVITPTPSPTVVTITRTPPGLTNPTIPIDPVTSPEPTTPTSTTNSLMPTISTSTTDSSGPTDPPGPEGPSTSRTNSTRSIIPTSSRISSRPTIFTSSGGFPQPTNAGDMMKSGTSARTVLVVLLLWAFV